MNIKTLTLLCFATATFVGCDSRIDAVNLKMAEIRYKMYDKNNPVLSGNKITNHENHANKRILVIFFFL